MCGLVGFLGINSVREDKAFTDLLYIYSVRGEDSTGIARIGRHNGKVDILKGAVYPHELINWYKGDRFISKPSKALLGHNRAATKGVISEDNAHPFQHGNITGMHNGTLSPHRLPNHTSFDTDSEAVIHSINVKEIDFTWKNITGAAALVWWNQREDQLFMVRNTQRPLFFSLTEDERGMWYASESWMLKAISERHKSS